MSNANPNRFGQNLGAGNERALFRDLYMAEVLAAFHTANVTADKHMVRTITEGRSAKFPVTGIASGGYHVPGTEILGRNIQHSEKTITVDDLLYSDVFIAQIDEAMNHYDVRGIYSKEQGEFLAKLYDENILRLFIKAAREQANIPGVTASGGKVVDADMRINPSKLAAAIFAARTDLDEKGIPSSDVNGFFKPAQIALLIQGKDALNKDWNGSGSYADGSIAMVGGVPLVKTSNLPIQNLSDNAAITAAGRDPGVILEKYRGNFADTVGVVAHKSAVGTVKLMDLDVEINYDFRRKGNLIVSSYALGSGVLRPECAVELRVAA